MHIQQTPEGPAFSEFLPVYNWFYPLSGTPLCGAADSEAVFERVASHDVRSRAIYVHIPFCSSICTFCTFVKKTLRSEQEVGEYVDALTREIAIKARCSAMTDVPIRAIFFGGGTPSVLQPEQLHRIVVTIQEHFDLSCLTEFSVEMSPLDLTPEKLQAMREAGVTHARFGVQTFNPFYRQAFNLHSTIDQVHAAANELPKYFPRVSFDMLYGMHGQSADEFFADIQTAASLGPTNIAVYPINNSATQPRLDRTIAAAGRSATSSQTKYYMNMILREVMGTHQFLPHNGHEYVKCNAAECARNPVVTDTYSFVYHEHVYGYSSDELLGFGANAVSRIHGHIVDNTPSIREYVSGLTKDNRVRMRIRRHPSSYDAARGVVLRLPYHGRAQKCRILWSEIDPCVTDALERVIAAGFAHDTGDTIELTEYGWRWYVNLMYYLSPPDEKRIIDTFISTRVSNPSRMHEETKFHA